MSDTGFSEQDVLAEVVAAVLEGELGWVRAGSAHATSYVSRTGSRESGETRLVRADSLRAALSRLNPCAPTSVIDDAVFILSHVGDERPLADTNLAMLHTIRHGINMRDRFHRPVRLRVVDFEDLESNEFRLELNLLVAAGEARRRLDLVGFVNGLPLLVVCDVSTVPSGQAWWSVIRDYVDAVPSAFSHSVLVGHSDGRTFWCGGLGNLRPSPNVLGSCDRLGISEGLHASCRPDRLLSILQHYSYTPPYEVGLLGARTPSLDSRLRVEDVVHHISSRWGMESRLGIVEIRSEPERAEVLSLLVHRLLRDRRCSPSTVLICSARRAPLVGLAESLGTNDIWETRLELTAAGMAHAMNERVVRVVLTTVQSFLHLGWINCEWGEVDAHNGDVLVVAWDAQRGHTSKAGARLREFLPNARFFALVDGTPMSAEQERLLGEHFGPRLSTGRCSGL